MILNTEEAASPPVFRSDEEGQYTVYVGKACTECGLELTSRTRAGKQLMCRECNRVKVRDRMRATRSTTAARLPVISDAQAAQVQRLNALFRAWIVHPADESVFRVLHIEMQDYEMKARLRRLLPTVPVIEPRQELETDLLSPPLHL